METQSQIDKYALTARFLDALEMANSLVLTVEKHQQILLLVQNLPETVSEMTLKYTLIPLVAKTPDEQVNAYKVFDKVLTDYKVFKPLKIQTSSFFNRFTSFKKWFIYLLLILSMVVVYFNNRTPVKDIKEFNYTREIKMAYGDSIIIDYTDSFRINDQLLKSVNYDLPLYNRQSVKVTLSGFICRFYALKPGFDTLGLYFERGKEEATVFKILYYFQVKDTSSVDTSFRPDSVQSDIPIQILKDKSTLNFGWQYRSFPFEKQVFWLVLVSLIVLGTLRWRNRKPLKPTLDNSFYILQPSSQLPPFVWNIKINDLPTVEPSPALLSLTQALRRRVPQASLTVDVPKTVQQTATKAGRLELSYKQKSNLSEYLVLIELPNVNFHRARLFAMLFDWWAQSGVYIDRFFYKSDIRRVWNDQFSRGLSLSDLQEKYPTHRLLIFGDGFHLLSTVDGQLESWTSIFDLWEKKAILTPHSPTSWDAHEATITEKFSLAPATLEGLSFIADAFHFAVSSADIYVGADVPTTETEPILLRGFDETLLIEILKGHFTHYPNGQKDDRLLQWIASCAVYQQLEWDWTIALGQFISKKSVSPNELDTIVTFKNLFQLTRLEWFNIGKMPDNARTILLNWLKEEYPDVLLQVRQYLKEILMNNPPPKDSVAFESFQMTLAFNEFFLKPNAEALATFQKLLNDLAERGVLPKDFVTVNLLHSEANTLDVVIPELWVNELQLNPLIQSKVDKKKQNEPITFEEVEEYLFEMLLIVSLFSIFLKFVIEDLGPWSVTFSYLGVIGSLIILIFIIYRNKLWLSSIIGIVLLPILWLFSFGTTTNTYLSLVVYPYERDERQVSLLLKDIKIVLNFEGRQEIDSIRKNGFYTFTENKLRGIEFGKRVGIELIGTQGYELEFPDSTYILDGKPIYLAIRKPILIKGVVKTRKGDKVKGVEVSTLGISVFTDDKGFFELKVPNSKGKNTYELTFFKQGYKMSTKSNLLINNPPNEFILDQ